jgi:hypothetical protein
VRSHYIAPSKFLSAWLLIDKTSMKTNMTSLRGGPDLNPAIDAWRLSEVSSTPSYQCSVPTGFDTLNMLPQNLEVF